MSTPDPQKEKAKADAKKRIWKDIEKTGDNSLVPCDQAAYAKLQELFDKTVGHAIETWGPGEWERKAARNFIRRHVKLIARIAKNLADAANRECVTADDLETAADLVIRRAKKACKAKFAADPSIKIFGRPCDGY